MVNYECGFFLIKLWLKVVLLAVAFEMMNLLLTLITFFQVPQARMISLFSTLKEATPLSSGCDDATKFNKIKLINICKKA